MIEEAKTTTTAVTAPKTASPVKNIGANVNYATNAAVRTATTVVPKVAPSAPKAPTYTSPAVSTGNANRDTKKAIKYDYETYLSALSALETAKAQAVQAQNTHLNTQELIEKGKELFKDSGNLAAAQADVQRIAAKNSANTLTNAVKKAGNSGAALLGAQANANRAAASAAVEYGQNVWNSYSNNADVNYQSLGVTGSDQTGASIHGFRDDTSYKTPNENWTSGERQLYEQYLKNNPKEAEEYAIRTNDRHNQKAHDAEVQEIRDWTSENGAHGVAGWIGARAANTVSFLEGYNQSLERAAIGRNNVSRNAVPSEIKDTVDDTNEQNITEKYGETAGKIYKYGTQVVDGVFAKKILGKEIAPVRTAINAVEKTNEWYQNSEADSVGEFIVGVSDRIKNIEVGSRHWFAEKQGEIDRRTEVYIEKGFSERTARWKATKELLEQSMK